ncbi:MAG: META domain-containing protein [Propionibacteriaceae bacterium]|nr:META domain-containing protein [Propionibacteriaceae bacterium]
MSRCSLSRVAGGLAASLLLMTGCATAVPAGESHTNPASGAKDELSGTAWVLESMGGASKDEATTMTVQFTAEGSISGSGGCNRFMGTFTMTGDDLSIEPQGTTMMACEPAVMELETSFLEALQGAKSYAVDGEKLTLSDASEKELLVFEAQSDALPGSAWVVTGYNDGNEAVTSPLTDSVAEVSFDEDGSLSGSGGCNRFMGTFAAEAGVLTIEPLASTKMMCPEPEGVMEQESALMAALESSTKYTMEGDELRLTNAEDATTLTASRG